MIITVVVTPPPHRHLLHLHHRHLLHLFLHFLSVVLLWPDPDTEHLAQGVNYAQHHLPRPLQHLVHHHHHYHQHML